MCTLAVAYIPCSITKYQSCQLFQRFGADICNISGGGVPRYWIIGGWFCSLTRVISAWEDLQEYLGLIKQLQSFETVKISLIIRLQSAD